MQTARGRSAYQVAIVNQAGLSTSFIPQDRCLRMGPKHYLMFGFFIRCWLLSTAAPPEQYPAELPARAPNNSFRVASISEYLAQSSRIETVSISAQPLIREHALPASIPHVCGRDFVVLTVFSNRRVEMCKIFGEISLALALALRAGGLNARQMCCGVGDHTCVGGQRYDVGNAQVILLGAIDLMSQVEHLWGPILLPARPAPFHPLVLQKWLPRTTSTMSY